MRECEIREALKKSLRKDLVDISGIIVEELSVCGGSARVDMAVIGPSLHGYEIKSEFDTFKRLNSQITYYNRCFEYVSLVVSNKHLDKALSICPTWWGIMEPITTNGEISFIEHKISLKNPAIDPNAIVQLLWKEEAADALSSLNNGASISRKRRKELWLDLVEQLEIDKLCSIVKEKLIARNNWRENFPYAL